MKLIIEYLENYRDEWPRLAYQHAEDAGFDLRAAIDAPIILKAHAYQPIPTGIKIQYDESFPLPPLHTIEFQIRARSGLAAKHGVTILNGVGTIDRGYRGEIHSILINHSDQDFVINPGDRISQCVVAYVLQPEFVTGVVTDNTTRSTGGFGSTNIQ